MLNLKPVDMQVRIKRLMPDAVMPSKAREGDAGFDCVAITDGAWNVDRTYIEYKTGLSVQMPSGYHVELFPRSSISKYDLVLCNSIGLVDNGYRGEIVFRFKYISRETQSPLLYKKGDKIGQIVVRKTYDFPVIEVSELSETDRGTGGFGSTDIPRE